MLPFSRLNRLLVYCLAAEFSNQKLVNSVSYPIKHLKGLQEMSSMKRSCRNIMLDAFYAQA